MPQFSQITTPPVFAASRFDLADLYRKTFGYIGTPYLTARPEAYVPGNSFLFPEGSKNAEMKPATGDLFSRPYFMETQIRASEADEWFLLPNAPLISITGRNKIIRTEIDGQDGTFKEHWGTDDYQITIQGIIADEELEPGEYPEELVASFRRLFEVRKSLFIQNDLLTLFNITLISVEAMEMPGEAGAQEYQAYRIFGYSDKEYELELSSIFES